MKKQIKILLVDDAPNVEEAVIEKFSTIGIDCLIEAHIPKKRSEPFGGCILPSGKQFDEFDLALVDLELFPVENPIDLSPDDLRGGTEILPFLRREAPWMPIIAYSQHFAKVVNRFLPIACSFGFDGYLPRGIFLDRTFSHGDWKLIHSRANLLRKAIILGETYTTNDSNSVTIDLHPNDAADLSSQFTGWRNVVGEIFYFSKKVILKRLAGGLSGALVFQVFAKQDQRFGGKEGQWLLKLSSSPSKLHTEIQAHTRLMRSGVKHARMAQPLWQGVLNNHGCAAIAFNFAHGTEELATLLGKDASLIDNYFNRLILVLKEFYGASDLSRNILSTILTDWSGSRDALAKAADVLGTGSTVKLLKGIISGARDDGLINTIEYKQTLIHGDLHLGNIMFGESDILIDFSRSDFGPIAVDLARLAADLVVRMPKLRDSSIPDVYCNEPNLIGSQIKKCGDALGFGPGDFTLYNLFLKIFLARHLTYPDSRVSKEVKCWIIENLKIST